jgi:hypothetical protein
MLAARHTRCSDPSVQIKVLDLMKNVRYGYKKHSAFPIPAESNNLPRPDHNTCNGYTCDHFQLSPAAHVMVQL